MLGAGCVPVIFAIMLPMGGCDNDIMYIYVICCTTFCVQVVCIPVLSQSNGLRI